MWISPFVSNVVIVASLAILLPVEDYYCPSLQYPLVFFASFVKSLSPPHH